MLQFMLIALLWGSHVQPSLQYILPQSVFTSPELPVDGENTLKEEEFNEPVAFAANVPEYFSQYADDTVVRVFLDSREEKGVLMNELSGYNLDVWKDEGDEIDVRIHRDGLPRLEREGWKFTVVISNVTETLLRSVSHEHEHEHEHDHFHNGADNDNSDDADPAFTPSPFSSYDRFFSDYQRLESFNTWMRLQASLFPDLSELFSLGTSSEGRTIMALRLHGHRSRQIPVNEKRPAIVVFAGVHAREWIANPTVVYAAQRLMSSYDSDPQSRRLLDSFDWIFVPVVNVDGYEYTWTNDRLWRKNRQSFNYSSCVGIDLDHNFDFAFDYSKRARNPCSEMYQGKYAFEAPEAAALAKLLSETLPNSGYYTAGLIDVHSYSQSVLWPYASSCDIVPRDEENFEELAIGMVKELHSVHRHVYMYGQACTSAGIYSEFEETGTALDWSYELAGVKWPYVVKLRDTGNYGFLLPAHHIIPTAEEFYAMLRYYGDFISQF